VSFVLPEASEVWVEVFDVRGRHCGEFIHSTLAPGSYELPWDARSGAGVMLEPGVYLVRMRARAVTSAAAYESTRKLVLSR
jgi:hypothetical protein